jgi:hypothetical protein
MERPKSAHQQVGANKGESKPLAVKGEFRGERQAGRPGQGTNEFNGVIVIHQNNILRLHVPVHDSLC